MKRPYFYVFVVLIFALTASFTIPNGNQFTNKIHPCNECKNNIQDISPDCKWNGKKLYGKVKFVQSNPDIKVKLVESFPDLKVKMVESFPDHCGEWQIVESFPDLKVKIVESFPDIKVKYVESFPGIP